MPYYQEKYYNQPYYYYKATAIKDERTKQASEPDSSMAMILELPDWTFKTTIINMSRVLMDKIGSMQKMAKVNREIEIQRDKQKEMLKIKNSNKTEECP